jgi:hypothetical protein
MIAALSHTLGDTLTELIPSGNDNSDSCLILMEKNYDGSHIPWKELAQHLLVCCCSLLPVLKAGNGPG